MRNFVICLCAVYLIGRFQSVSTAEPDAKLPITWGRLKQKY